MGSFLLADVGWIVRHIAFIARRPSPIARWRLAECRTGDDEVMAGDAIQLQFVSPDP